MKQFNQKAVAIVLFLAMTLSVISSDMVYGAADINGDLRFDFATDSEGFSVTKGGAMLSAGSGTIKTSKTETELHITKNGVSINPDEYKYVRFRIKNNSDGIRARFILRGNDWSTGLYQPTVNITQGDSDFKEYVMELNYPKGAN